MATIDTSSSTANELPYHDNSDYSVIEKAGMSLGHAPAGLLLPGVDSKTHKEATRLCARDYLEHHVFFNDRKLHNHLNHHLLAVYSMGASAERLQGIFDGNRLIQRPSLPTHETITIDATNYINYLSQENYYPDFVRFFHKELDAAGDGWHSVVAKYMFEPHIFPLVLNGLLHPLIQLGYALEFESKAIAAAALAQTCIHGNSYKKLYTPEFFSEIQASFAGGNYQCLSILEIFDRMRNERTDMKIPFGDDIFTDENRTVSEKLAVKYAKYWIVDADEKAISAKYRELLSVVSLWYIASTRPGYKLLLDFFTMHCVTSAYFLPIIFGILSTEQKAQLLHAHYAFCLSLFSLQGTPQLFIAPTHTTGDSHSAARELYGDSANPWLGVFERAINSNDMHVPKVIRSLWRGSVLCGSSDLNVNSQAPLVNWLYIARRTVDSISADGFVSDVSEIDDAFTWSRGMLGYDEYWEKQSKI
ncbi:hypothetical protein GGI25_003203 [Coemansia spiralis]|uniref:HypA-like protein n=2 Tax=Coemansia TaxID=4863 RepID=A0A9W8G7K1_9FUNG|nr:hypothetical protein BX070DRAFT_225873 [Coemansia spiralis]KAJ1991843.1 hypothetical protein EDC05_003198 [Coemansia umbellata]KAJ2621893.1 hypothetical protein GGI26_003736 [Coemansia sp. RSA 1358]KAJ2677448.1 hypothetical protein GGI25_003203 [Coemansia spiralis]